MILYGRVERHGITVATYTPLRTELVDVYELKLCHSNPVDCSPPTLFIHITLSAPNVYEARVNDGVLCYIRVHCAFTDENPFRPGDNVDPSLDSVPHNYSLVAPFTLVTGGQRTRLYP